jgi:hypothetical protein
MRRRATKLTAAGLHTNNVNLSLRCASTATPDGVECAVQQLFSCLSPGGLGITNAFLLLVILRSLTIDARRLKLRGDAYSEGPFGHNKVDEPAWTRR